MQAGKHSHLKYILPIIALVIVVLVLLVAAIGMSSLLGETQNTLTSTQSELSSALAESGTTHTKLTLAETELSQTKTDLTATKNKLTDTQKEKQTVSDNLTITLKKLTETEAKYVTTSTQLETTRQQSDSLKSTADNLQANYDRLTTGYGYVLKDPTYREVKAFITADTTDANLYVNDSYVCEDFAFDVKVHAMQHKIRCAYVSIRFFGANGGHAIVAFNTTDRGIVYIESESDEEVNLVAGKHYWTQCVITSPSHYYLNPTTYNDTIDRYNVIW